MDCESCKQLNGFGHKVEVDMIFDIGTGYVRPKGVMLINYCPVCGRKIGKESEDKE